MIDISIIAVYGDAGINMSQILTKFKFIHKILHRHLWFCRTGYWFPDFT